MAANPPFSVERSTAASRITAIVAGLALIVLITLPFWGERSAMRLVVEMSYYLALAHFWNLLTGYAGVISMGQQAYVGLGGYVYFYLTTFHDVPPLLALPATALAVAVVAVPTAFAVFRLRGAYFAVGTWVAAEVMRLLVSLFTTMGGGSGFSLPLSVVKSISADRATRELLVYYIGLGAAVAATLVIVWLLRSRYGLALAAIRDSEGAADSLGVDKSRVKFMTYTVAAAGTGLVGAIIFLQKLRITPDSAFSINDWTAVVFFIVIIGGLGTIEGPFIGTAIYFLLTTLFGQLGSIYMIMLGTLAVAVMLKAPEGVWGLVRRRLGVDLVPVRRRLILHAPPAVPQAVALAEVEQEVEVPSL